jgi:hypothetical protein
MDLDKSIGPRQLSALLAQKAQAYWQQQHPTTPYNEQQALSAYFREHPEQYRHYTKAVERGRETPPAVEPLAEVVTAKSATGFQPMTADEQQAEWTRRNAAWQPMPVHQPMTQEEVRKAIAARNAGATVPLRKDVGDDADLVARYRDVATADVRAMLVLGAREWSHGTPWQDAADNVRLYHFLRMPGTDSLYALAKSRGITP